MKCIMNHKIGFMSLLVVFFSFFLSISFGLSVNAFEFNTGPSTYWYDNMNRLYASTSFNQPITFNPNSGVDRFTYLFGPDNSPDYAQSFNSGDLIITTGSWLTYFDYDTGGGNDLLSANCPVYYSGNITQVDCQIDRITDISGGGHSGVISWISVGRVTSNFRTPYIEFKSSILNTSSHHAQYLYPGQLSIKSSPYSSLSSDYSSVLDNIHNAVTELYRSVCGASSDTICYKLDVIAENLGNISSVAITDAIDDLNLNQIATNEKLDTQIELQREANEQQQEQYESEKEEESDREAEQSESADEMAGIFNFTSFNPFSPIFALFGDGSGCVNIPTLSSWLHTQQTRVCPFFPASVRNVATPILGIASMMLIFGFFIHWLKGNDGNSGITIKGGF